MPELAIDLEIAGIYARGPTSPADCRSPDCGRLTKLLSSTVAKSAGIGTPHQRW
jgi:hypothetical protein